MPNVLLAPQAEGSHASRGFGPERPAHEESERLQLAESFMVFILCPLSVHTVETTYCCFLVSKSCWTIAHQASLSMGFPRQEYWSGLPFPSPGDLPDPGMEHSSPALQVGSLPLNHQESPEKTCLMLKIQTGTKYAIPLFYILSKEIWGLTRV